MSFSLFIFERTDNLKTSQDVLEYMSEFTEYTENKDYNSLNGCSEIISKWAKRMFAKFPPINGEDASPDAIASAGKELELHLTDYSLGKNGAFCGFAWPVAEEALEYAISILEEMGVGIYDPQDGKIYGKGIKCLKYRTDGREDSFGDWAEIEASVQTLDSTERGTSHRENAFITVWFEQDGQPEDDYIQCTPNYQKKSFVKTLFQRRKENLISGYIFEIMKDDSLYQTQVTSKEELIILMKDWCLSRKEPDIGSYDKILL
ncbi:hypothetical protein EII17_07540 [Clostridiales bacterium COT073_COT-073]|nr:hypothetical protein EII17_07540 [Clostridiales bacterium COT073_COT-073]